MEAFEKLDVWRRSCRLSVQLYGILQSCRDWGYRDQVTRAALSIPSNIAEGYERDSVREYVRFLRIAKGSSGELRTQLYIGAEAGLIERDQAMALVREASEITRMLHTLARRLQEAPANS
jgi:four helix bundle protein